MPCHFKHEKQLLQQHRFVGGVDEAGRGALAGPVVVAMVILDPKNYSTNINDSKQLTVKKRDLLAKEIKKNSLSYSVSVISSEKVDKINVLQATYLGVKECYQRIPLKPNHILLDALKIEDIPVSQTTLIKGDTISYSIAAASIIAKTERDKIMVNYARKYPKYYFENNKGYGVKKHILALEKYGPTPIHRKSFQPITNILEENLLSYLNNN